MSSSVGEGRMSPDRIAVEAAGRAEAGHPEPHPSLLEGQETEGEGPGESQGAALPPKSDHLGRDPSCLLWPQSSENLGTFHLAGAVFILV